MKALLEQLELTERHKGMRVKTSQLNREVIGKVLWQHVDVDRVGDSIANSAMAVIGGAKNGREAMRLLEQELSKHPVSSPRDAANDILDVAGVNR